MVNNMDSVAAYEFDYIEEYDPIWTDLKETDQNALVLKKNHIQKRVFRNFSLMNVYRDDVNREKVLKIDPGTFSNFENLTNIRINGFNLGIIQQSTFSNLQNLKLLDLSQNRIERIEMSSFFQLNALESLDLSKNSLTEIDELALNELSSLTRLNLNRNRISKVSSEFFKALGSLTELDLSENIIQYLEPDTFQDLRRLEKVNMSYNKLKSMPENMFKHLDKIVEINLASNSLERIPDTAFNNLTSLQTLRLENNLIREIVESNFNNLTSLKHLGLNNNFIESIEPNSFKNINSPNAIYFYLTLNHLRNFSLDLFAKVNPRSVICHVGNNFIYDCKRIHNELFTIVYMEDENEKGIVITEEEGPTVLNLEDLDDNQPEGNKEKKVDWQDRIEAKSERTKTIKLRNLNQCSHLIYVILQSNDLKTTRDKLASTRVFDILIQDSAISKYFVLNLIELVNSDGKLFNATIYKPDFQIDDESFKVLCQYGDKNLLEFFLNTINDSGQGKKKNQIIPARDEYNYMAYLNIALVNNNETTALCILNHFKRLIKAADPLEDRHYRLILKVFFYQKYTEVYNEYKDRYMNQTGSQALADFVEPDSTNLTIIFAYKWLNFLTEILNLCQNGKDFNFRILEFHQIMSLNKSLGSYASRLKKNFNKKEGISSNKSSSKETSVMSIPDDLEKEEAKIESEVPGGANTNHILSFIADTNHINLLKHPTTLRLLQLKYSTFPFLFYYFNLLLYFVFLVFYTVNADVVNFDSESVRFQVYKFFPILSLLCFFLIGEILKLIYILSRDGIGTYLTTIQYPLELFTFIFCFVAVFLPNTEEQINNKTTFYSITILMTYIILVLRSDKIPLLGPFVEVFRKCFNKYFKMLPMFVVLCFGFLQAFRIRSHYNIYAQARNETDLNQITYFDNSTSILLVRMVNMILGNLEIGDDMGLGDDMDAGNWINYVTNSLNSYQNYISSLLFKVILCLFVFILVIFIYNLFIGIAVDSISDVIDNSQIQTFKAKIRFVLEIEDFMNRILQLVNHSKQLRILKRFELFIIMIQWILNRIIIEKYESQRTINKTTENKLQGQIKKLSWIKRIFHRVNKLVESLNQSNEAETKAKEIANLTSIILRIDAKMNKLDNQIHLLKTYSHYNENFDEVIDYLKFKKDNLQYKNANNNNTLSTESV